MHVYMYINMHTCTYNLLSSFNVAHMWMCPGLRLGIWHPRSEFIHGRNCSLMFSLRAFDCCCSSCRVGTLWSFLRLYWHVSWCCHFSGLVQATVLVKFLGMFSLPCLGDTVHSAQASWPLAFTIFPPPSMTFPELQCRDCITEACICVGHSTVPYSLHCEQGWLFYNDLCCKKELPWLGVRAAHICVCT